MTSVIQTTRINPHPIYEVEITEPDQVLDSSTILDGINELMYKLSEIENTLHADIGQIVQTNPEPKDSAEPYKAIGGEFFIKQIYAKISSMHNQVDRIARSAARLNKFFNVDHK